jgi:hypothetical protein
MPATAETLARITGTLVQAGFLPRPQWWTEQFRRCYALATAKRFAVRAGRGSIKSTSIVDASINECICGDWAIPPGEVHYFAFVSKNMGEAGQRLRQIAARLRALGIPFDQSGDEIVLRDMPRGFRVFGAQVGAVSGFRCFGFAADELAKWTNADHSANPAPEVVASLRAMTVTHSRAREFYVSSPMGTSDLHYEIIEAGDTEDQVVAIAPTWVANPSISEAQTRKLEPDERIWLREYAAIPQASLSSAFDPTAVARAFRTPPAAAEWFPKIGIVDAASGGGDSFTYGSAGYVIPAADDVQQWLYAMKPRLVNVLIGGVERMIENPDDLVVDNTRAPTRNQAHVAATRPTVVFSQIGSFDGRFAGSIAGSAIVDHIAREFRKSRIDLVVGDQRESFFLGSEFKRHGLRFVPLPWTNQNKIESIVRLKRLFAEDSVVLPQGREKLRKELLNYAEKITSTGATTYSARGSGADDEVSLLVTFALAEMERLVPGSPFFARNTKHEVSGR